MEAPAKGFVSFKSGFYLHNLTSPVAFSSSALSEHIYLDVTRDTVKPALLKSLIDQACLGPKRDTDNPY